MKTLLCIIAFLSSMLCHAQGLLDDGNVWSYATVGKYDPDFSGNMFDCEYQFIKYYINGEEVIHDKVYKRIYADIVRYITKPNWKYSEDNTNSYTLNGYYMISLREEDRRIYVDRESYKNSFERNGMIGWWIPDHVLTRVDDEFVLYDFNVELTDSVLANIGNLYSLIYPSKWLLSMYEETQDAIYRRTFLNLFYRDGKLEYKSPNFYPDPFFPDELADGIKKITNLPKNEGNIYNLSGQRIKSMQKGLNIIDGRKVWVR